MGAAAALSVVVVLFQTCSVGEAPDPAHPTALEYPSAPEQQLPRTAQEFDQAEGQPVAEMVDEGWVVETAERTGIPKRALQAYAGAAAYVSETNPECGIGWNTLAGIGQVESVHGAYDDAQIDEDGNVEPPIIGVALDGGEGVMEIPDTDDGEFDGDDEWDRAVGPMQFIPRTWERYGTDGNLDTEADVHNVDDAVLSAAIYLCDEGGDLTTDDGWNDAVIAYNQSVEYANEVAGYAEDYRFE